MAVAVARTGVGITLIAVPAEELAYLGFQRGLDHQAHAEAGGLLQRLGQRLAASEQLVDLGADALGGR
jgi:uridine phosphorylase